MTGYLDKAIIPLVLIMSKMSRHVKIFIVKDKGKDKEVKIKIRGKDKNNNLTSFHILFFLLNR